MNAEGQALQMPCLLGPLRVAQRDHAAFAGGDDLVGVEAEAADVAEPSDLASPVGRPVRFGAVLDHVQAMLPRDLEHRIHIDGVAVQVDHDDGLGARCDALPQQRRVEIEGFRIDIDRNGMGTLVHDGEKRRHVGQRRDQHLVARPHREGEEREVQGSRPAGHRHAVRAAAVLCEFLLEHWQVVSKESGDRSPLQRFVHVMRFRLVEHRFAHRHPFPL
jgi:hypothetical protein